jgi:uncharacterized protein YqhQ
MQQYCAIGGQAVIEGVMMRSPNAFVIAVRKSDGSIRLRWDQWYGLAKKFPFFRKPFLRGVLVLFETMANGIVALNYSANIAMDDELRKEALAKGVSNEDFEKKKKSSETIGIGTFLSILASFAFGIGLFVFVPHILTAWLEKIIGASWGLQSFAFHAIDGVIKACMFLAYVSIIGLFPDIKRVFQYHGAEHKSISTFEAGKDLVVENAQQYPTFHPRCGTTFVFFLLFISIIIFAVLFAIVPIGAGLPIIPKHLLALITKVFLSIPIAGISYELIKLMGSKGNTWWGSMISYPGRLMQKLTTREPAADQLEVALASIKAVLFLEDKFQLANANEKVVKLFEIDIKRLDDIESSTLKPQDLLEDKVSR